MKQRDFARHLRSEQTDAESMLWHRLRAHRLFGLKFRRQQPMGPYVVDFLCPEKKLIVELDGGQHQERVGYDESRDAWLKTEGYTVLRYWNNELISNLDGVLEDLCRQAGMLETPSPSPPAPLPSRERGEEPEAAAVSAPLCSRAKREEPESVTVSAPPPRGGRGWGEGGATS